MQKYLPLALLVIVVLFFFKSFFLQGKLPIPADTIIGLYHPFRDLYAKDYPRGIPFKNFLITDPVRQQYPWRELAVSLEKRLELPLWNPYSFSGTPLLANHQTASFYPLNVLFFLFPFSFVWNLLILLQPLTAVIFFYTYFDNLKMNKWASILGAIAFSFSGSFVAWMEWGTMLHVTLWMPLILLSIDKIFFYFQDQNSSKLQFKNKQSLLSHKFESKKFLGWSLLFVFSLVASFFAGHLQIFFYVFIISLVYFFARWIQFRKNIKLLFIFIIYYSLFTIFTSVQWLPTLQAILLSAREIDTLSWHSPGWFLPWQNLIQFVAPDFFGNPATLNYWGVLNYGEFVGYVGIVPLVFAIFALFFRRDKKTLFFGTMFFLSLIFSLPTFFAKIPFILKIPFVDTAQTSRLLFIIDFSLVSLFVLGFDYFLSSKRKREILYSLGFVLFVFICLWAFIFLSNNFGVLIFQQNLSVAKRNLIFPTMVFAITLLLLFFWSMPKKFNRKITLLLCCALLLLVCVDLIRFFWKFTPFTNKEYLFPNTKAIEFLQKNAGYFRIMSVDSRILPPNFSVIYRLQSIDGYDPLYLLRYGEFIAVSERGKPDISPPFGFNRIITPHNYESKIIDLLGVKYVLSLSDLDSPKLRKVFQEGQTQVYENKEVLPRTFFVERVQVANNKQEAIKIISNKDFELRKTAIIEEETGDKVTAPLRQNIGETEIISYSENTVVIKTENSEEGFLVLTDSFYPTWHAKVDGTPTKIYRTDYNFRGIIVPKGKHIVEFYITLI